MSVKYLIPCECGDRVPVSKTQAGEIVLCSCGKRIVVPTLMRLKTLDTIDDDQSRHETEANWNAGNGLFVVGIAITLIALAGVAYFMLNRPPRPEEIFSRDKLDQSIDTMTLPETYSVWEYLRHGLHRKRKINTDYQNEMKWYRIRLGVTLAILAVMGGATLVGGIALARSKRTARDGSSRSNP